MGDHLIDVDVDGVGCGRMADDSLLTDLLIVAISRPCSVGRRVKRAGDKRTRNTLFYSIYIVDMMYIERYDTLGEI